MVIKRKSRFKSLYCRLTLFNKTDSHRATIHFYILPYILTCSSRFSPFFFVDEFEAQRRLCFYYSFVAGGVAVSGVCRSDSVGHFFKR